MRSRTMKKQDLAAAGKRKLEEFRKKKDKAAHSNASASESENGSAPEEEVRPDSNAWRRALENEINMLRSENGRLQAEVARERKERVDLRAQVSQMQTDVSTAGSQLQRLEAENRKAIEQATLFRRNLDTVSAEKNAAVAAKEDLAAQLRVAKRRLQEAEEEQYRAEEDTALLRSEVARLEALSQGHARRPSQEVPMVDNELEKAQAELQMTLTELQSAQQNLAVERQRQAALSSQLADATADKDDLEQALSQARTKLQDLQGQLRASQACTSAAESEATQARLEAAAARQEAEAKMAPKTPERALVASDDAERAELEEANTWLVNEKRKVERECKELAMMVERQEKGRQRLLAEIDSQSLEIERLFGENAGLHAGLNEYTAIAARWEQQVHELLAQNQELRAALQQLREEQRAAEESQTAQELRTVKPESRGAEENGADMVPATEIEEAKAREAKLKKQLTQSLARAEELAEQCAQLSADYNQVTHAMAKLSRAYQPLLSGIESKLLQMKQEAY